jgi:phosphoenolpyruvate carboxykinase (ATP)
MKLGYTRAMVRAALAGDLDSVPTEADPVFGLAVPTSVSDVPGEVLAPRETWTEPEAYDEAAKKLAGMFQYNFQQFADRVPESVIAAGPRTD